MSVQDFAWTYNLKYVDINGNIVYGVQDHPPYGGQCASLARVYLVQQCGYENISYGDGKDYVDIPNSKIVLKPQNGDLVVYPTLGGYYGHVGIYCDGKVFEQNPLPASYQRLKTEEYHVFVRPNYKETINDSKEDITVMIPTLPYISTKVKLREDAVVYMTNTIASERKDIKPFKKGEMVIVHHVLIQDVYWKNLYWGLAYLPNNPEVAGLIKMNDNSTLYYDIVEEYYIK